MYHERDLDATVAAGTLNADTVASLRRFVAARRSVPDPADRYGRFNWSPVDTLPAIGVSLVVAAIALIATPLFGFYASLLVAATT